MKQNTVVLKLPQRHPGQVDRGVTLWRLVGTQNLILGEEQDRALLLSTGGKGRADGALGGGQLYERWSLLLPLVVCVWANPGTPGPGDVGR